MSDLLNNQPIDIDLFYTVQKTKSGAPVVVVLTDDEAAKMKANAENKDKVKQNRFRFQMLTWAASNRLLQQATRFDHIRGEDSINLTAYRDMRLKTILIGWDLKDHAGNPVPLSEAAIDALQQPIALALLQKYDEAITVDKEESAKN